jgi:nucleotide-binding universal stress UspA family protein
MKTYRRILVPIYRHGQAESLLGTLQDIVADGHPQVMVVRIVAPDSFAEPDGPAAMLPEERAARQAGEARRRLDLLLARLGLGWVESQVVWRSPAARLREIVAEWHPDLVIACRGERIADLPAGVDVLATAGHGLLRRLADLFTAPQPRHA